MDQPQPGTLDHLYAAPDGLSSSASAAVAAARLRSRAAKLLGASVAGFVLSIGLAVATSSGSVGSLAFLVAALLGLVGAGHGW